MFGAVVFTAWAVTYAKNGIKYYLSDIKDSQAFVWTTRRDKAKKYATESAATEVAESIKTSRKIKKAEINVTKV